MNKTPEEIKKGLECAVTMRCAKTLCPYFMDDEDDSGACISKIQADALAYIQQLEARIDTVIAKVVLFDEAVAAGEKMKRERDAAVEELRRTFDCSLCIHSASGECDGWGRCGFNKPNWQWRGVQE